MKPSDLFRKFQNDETMGNKDLIRGLDNLFVSKEQHEKEFKDVQEMYGSACFEIDKLKKNIKSLETASIFIKNMTKLMMSKEITKLKDKLYKFQVVKLDSDKIWSEDVRKLKKNKKEKMKAKPIMKECKTHKVRLKKSKWGVFYCPICIGRTYVKK